MTARTEQNAPGLRLEGITTVVDDTPVLHRLSLRVPPGTITMLMGPSGSGKTTLIRHITGQLEPDRGTVEVGGRNVWEADHVDLTRIRKSMSVMLGGSSVFDTSLFGSLSAYGNLDYTLKAHDVPEAERERRGMAVLRQVGLDDRAGDLPEALPAHARKRLALARALVADTPLLILDDIEAGLDARYSAQMIGAIEQWRERTHGTVLITTHNIKLARELGEHVAILCSGRIVAAGEASELLDGVEGSDEFDRRFRVSELWGPLDAGQVRDDLDEDDGKKKITFQYNPQMTIAVAIAIVTIMVLFVTARLAGVF